MSAINPPALPEHLYIRLSDERICIARYDALRPAAFAFSVFRPEHSKPLGPNLIHMAESEELLKAPARGSTYVLIDTPATYVPLADFQESECETLYRFCFPKHNQHRIFYDVVGAADSVVIFGLREEICQALENAIDNVIYASSHTALLRHFATKGANVCTAQRFFINLHEKATDIYVFDHNRLTLANTFASEDVMDTIYYALNIASQTGARLTAGDGTPALAATPFYVSGEESRRLTVSRELRRFADEVIAIQPTAEFNRHVIAGTPGVPYDLMVHLIG